PQDPLPPRSDVLKIDVAAVDLEPAIGGGAGLIALHQREDPVSLDRKATIGRIRIEGLQVVEAQSKKAMQTVVARAVRQRVEDHLLLGRNQPRVNKAAH